MDTLDANMPEMSGNDARKKLMTSQDEVQQRDLPNMKQKSIDVDIFEPWKTRGKRVDYRQLNDPIPEIDNDMQILSDIVYAIITGGELTSLKNAQCSPEWPQWQKAMEAELHQLHAMNMWQLIDKQADAVPIANRWVFVCKRNKLGDIVRYKARLVAKGSTQCPGWDYNERYTPVIRMDTLRVILALVLVKKLKVHQLDIKGVYLLKETIYMKKLEGFDDKMGRVCHLIKTLYGLKKSG